MRYAAKSQVGVILTQVFMIVVCLFSTYAAVGQTSTNIAVTNAVQQAAVTRLGINLGDQTYWDSGQMMKNLIFQNPGFEGLKFRTILKCAHNITANSCQDDNQYSRQQTGFWKDGTYEMMSGTSAGITGKVIQSTQSADPCSGCGQTVQFDKSVNPAVGDYFVVTNYFPGSASSGWWTNISGGGTLTTELTDLSPNTTGKQALLMSAPAGKSVSVAQYFESFKGLSFIQLNGNFELTFRAKGKGGTNQLSVNVQRLQNGAPAFLNQNLTLTDAWKDYKLTFSANETGSAVGTVQLIFGAAGSNVELDDVSLNQTDSDPANTTVFRDDVVKALKELNPGTLRMMAAGAALGSDIPNQLAPVGARYRSSFSSTKTGVDTIAYGIDEFVHLCQTINADPWLTIPTATTPEEMTDLILYLTGDGSDKYSAIRIANGQTKPWTSVFTKIHIELGNETWNGDFKGESMAYPGYPQWANRVFATARQMSTFKASQFDLVLDGWSAVPGYNQGLLHYSTQHDSIDIAPYLMFSANDLPQATTFGAMLAEPEMTDETAAGKVYQDMQVAAAAPTPTYVNVYETNLGTMLGKITQAELDQLTPSVGAGLAHTMHMLMMMRQGVRYQNAFALQQYQFLRSDQKIVRMWGMVVDMGTTNRRRPQFLTQQLANTVIGGNMLTTTHTGANPTWDQPKADGVELKGAHYLQSFAFLKGNVASTIIFNLHQTSSLPVTFSGAGAPTGTVQVGQFTSANITDNNEFADNAKITNKTLSGVNSTTVVSLPPFSMTVLTWTTNGTQVQAQAPAFSVPAGTYTSSQTVALSDSTAGATIYYTTDGSTPTSASTRFASPITVSKSQTIKAIATASGVASSSVSSAVYSISASSVTNTPTFTPAAGTYATAQSVTISDTTVGATIFYTTDGSTPSTTSKKYTGAISVSTSETIKALATAANNTTSTIASAAYIISQQTSAPTFSVASGTYANTQTVALAGATVSSAIYYTLDGSTPTTTSTRYAAPITVSRTGTIKALAAAANHTPSPIATASYTISAGSATPPPTFSLAGGTYATAKTIGIWHSTSGAVVYYTLDGTSPTTASKKVTGTLWIGSTTTIKAISVAPNRTVSTIATVTYTIASVSKTAAPTFSLPGGTYTTAKTIGIWKSTSGDVVYYTLDGTNPTTASKKVTGTLWIGKTTTVKAVSQAPNRTMSAIVQAKYTIQ